MKSQDSSRIDINVANGGCKPAGRTQSNVEKTVVYCKGGLSLRGPSEFRSGFDSRHYHKALERKGCPKAVAKQLRRLRCMFHSSTYYFYCLSPERSGLIRAFSLVVKPRPRLHKAGSRDRRFDSTSAHSYTIHILKIAQYFQLISLKCD